MSSIRIVGLLAIAAVLMFIGVSIYNYGGDNAIRDVEKQNQKAGNAANTAVLDYDDCERAGRVWDYRARKCGRTAIDNRN